MNNNKALFNLCADLLDLSSEIFSRHGCNDYAIENNLENLSLVSEFIKYSDYPDDKPILGDEETSILLNDWATMADCAEALRRLAESD